MTVRSPFYSIARIAPLLAGALLCRAPDARAAAPVVTAGADRRFVVHGDQSAENLALLVWADRAAARLQTFLQRGWLGDPRRPTRFLIQRTDDPLVQSRALIEFEPDPRGEQRLRLIRPDELPPDAILTAFVHALCHRLLPSWPDPAPPGEVIPVWFAAGVAGNLFPGLRAEAARRLRDMDRRGAVPGLAALLRGECPPGARDEEIAAAAATLLDALRNQPAWSAALDDFLQAWRAGGAPSPELLAQRLGLAGGARAVEIWWRLWVAHQRHVRFGGRGDAEEWLRRLEERLQPGRLAQQLDWPAGALPQSFDDWVRHPDDPWNTDLAGRMAAQVESLLAQAPPEAAAAGQAWRDMLRALAESPPPGSRAGRRRAERLPKLLDAARRAEAEFRAGLLIMGDQRDFEPPW